MTDTFNASAFTTILGSVDGNTDFLGGSAGGLSFTPAPFTTGNAADFSADTNPIFANLTVASRLNGVLVPSRWRGAGGLAFLLLCCLF